RGRAAGGVGGDAGPFEQVAGPVSLAGADHDVLVGRIEATAVRPDAVAGEQRAHVGGGVGAAFVAAQDAQFDATVAAGGDVERGVEAVDEVERAEDGVDQIHDGHCVA